MQFRKKKKKVSLLRDHLGKPSVLSLAVIRVDNNKLQLVAFE